MPTLSEIESKISALRQRYAELDEKLVPKRNGIVDMAVSTAMGAVTAEIARLERLREKALVGDLIGEKSTESKSPPPQRPAALPMPVFATKNAELSDPLAGLERLPKTDQDRVDLWLKLNQWCCEQVNSELEGRQKAVDQNIPVAFTQGLFRSLIVQLGALQAEYRWLVAMGREHRKTLEGTLLERIEALEARPTMKYRGTWDENEQYNEGDFVTCGGSLYYCKRASRQKPPGDDYQLAAKRGRDGRDGKDAPR